MSALPPEADITADMNDVGFSNRPIGVKRYQTIHRTVLMSSRGLVLLSGIGTKALVWDFLCQGIR